MSEETISFSDFRKKHSNLQEIRDRIRGKVNKRTRKKGDINFYALRNSYWKPGKTIEAVKLTPDFFENYQVMFKDTTGKPLITRLLPRIL